MASFEQTETLTAFDRILYYIYRESLHGSKQYSTVNVNMIPGTLEYISLRTVQLPMERTMDSLSIMTDRPLSLLDGSKLHHSFIRIRIIPKHSVSDKLALI